jgi:hypothetical protein
MRRKSSLRGKRKSWKRDGLCYKSKTRTSDGIVCQEYDCVQQAIAGLIHQGIAASSNRIQNAIDACLAFAEVHE